MTDPIADMIIRIQNGYMARKDEVELPHSKVKEAIALLLKRERYVEDVSIADVKPQKVITMKLRYVAGSPAVTKVKRISKPGLRKYATTTSIPRALGGYGVTIISTSKGVMSDKEARKLGIGGELLCSIW